MKFIERCILAFSTCVFIACSTSSNMVCRKGELSALQENEQIRIEKSQIALSDPDFIDFIRYGYEENSAKVRCARYESSKNARLVVPEEGEVLEELYRDFHNVNYNFDVWTSITPVKNREKGESMHVDFLSMGIEFPVIDFRDIGCGRYYNILDVKDLKKFKHLKGLSFAFAAKAGGPKLSKDRKKIEGLYDNVNFEAIGAIRGLRYFRPPLAVEDKDLKIMKNLNNLEELNLRGCYNLRGNFIYSINEQFSSLKVLKISKMTLNTMNAIHLWHLRECSKFQYIEISTDLPPIKTRRIYKDEITEWLRGLL